MFIRRLGKGVQGAGAGSSGGSPAKGVPDWTAAALILGAAITLMAALIVFLAWVVSTRL
jgi:hypothetical protein